MNQKQYELKDHLGNVRVTFSDRKEPQDCDNLGDGWVAVATSVNNYYSFGMLQPGRNWNAGNYRFGFNGKENDNEVKGTGNQQDYGMRIYDPRLGRFLSADPLIVQEQKYPELSPYQFASNRPIDGIDKDGLEYDSAGVSIPRNPNLALSTAEQAFVTANIPTVTSNAGAGPGSVAWNNAITEFQNMFGVSPNTTANRVRFFGEGGSFQSPSQFANIPNNVLRNGRVSGALYNVLVNNALTQMANAYNTPQPIDPILATNPLDPNFAQSMQNMQAARARNAARNYFYPPGAPGVISGSVPTVTNVRNGDWAQLGLNPNGGDIAYKPSVDSSIIYYLRAGTTTWKQGTLGN